MGHWGIAAAGALITYSDHRGHGPRHVPVLYPHLNGPRGGVYPNWATATRIAHAANHHRHNSRRSPRRTSGACAPIREAPHQHQHRLLHQHRAGAVPLETPQLPRAQARNGTSNPAITAGVCISAGVWCCETPALQRWTTIKSTRWSSNAPTQPQGQGRDRTSDRKGGLHGGRALHGGGACMGHRSMWGQACMGEGPCMGHKPCMQDEPHRGHG